MSDSGQTRLAKRVRQSPIIPPDCTWRIRSSTSIRSSVPDQGPTRDQQMPRPAEAKHAKRQPRPLRSGSGLRRTAQWSTSVTIPSPVRAIHPLDAGGTLPRSLGGSIIPPLTNDRIVYSTMPRTILVTGGAGFIGSAVVRLLLGVPDTRVVNLDCLTYAGNLDSLRSVASSPAYAFEHADIRDFEAVREAIALHEPDAILHLAAESHVDRSIASPGDFISTNITGTHHLLEAARHYWMRLTPPKQDRFRFLHVSTTKSMELWARRARSTRTPPTAPTHRIRPARRPLITLRAPGSTHTDFR